MGNICLSHLLEYTKCTTHHTSFLPPSRWVPQVLQYHIQHTVPIGTSSLTPSSSTATSQGGKNRKYNATKRWYHKLCAQKKGRKDYRNTHNIRSSNPYIWKLISVLLERLLPLIVRSTGTASWLGNIFQLITFNRTWAFGMNSITNISQDCKKKSTPWCAVKAK